MRFERRARDYDHHALPQRAVVRRLAERIPAASTPGAPALELGAGTGELTRALLDKGYAVRATDLSASMIAVGKFRAPEAEWSQLDAWYPPAGCTPLLCSANLLQWCPDPADTLRRHRAALLPGGRMHHAVLVAPTLDELLSLSDAPAPIARRTAEDWLAAAREAGLNLLSHETLTLRREHPDALALLRELHGTGAVAQSGKLGAGRMKRLLDAYRRRFPSESGGVVSTWSALLFEAE